jgi:hypothetical protein
VPHAEHTTAGHHDPRGIKRTRVQLEKLVKATVKMLANGRPSSR